MNVNIEICLHNTVVSCGAVLSDFFPHGGFSAKTVPVLATEGCPGLLSEPRPRVTCDTLFVGRRICYSRPRQRVTSTL